jgi:hypothetical protein
MTLLYGGLGTIGYWSRGDAITGIVVFDLPDSPQARLAAACILVQVCVGLLNDWLVGWLVGWLAHWQCSCEAARSLQ